MSSSRRIALIAGLLTSLSGVAMYLWNAQRFQRQVERPQRIAVLSFENQSGDETLNWTERLTSFAVAQQLQALPRLVAYSASGANQAIAGGASRLVYGYTTRSGGALRVRYFVEDSASRSIVDSAELVSRDREWLPLLSRISAAAAGALRPGAQVSPLELHNDAAARLLSAGLTADDPGAAAGHFQAAAAADPACGWCWQAWAERLMQKGGEDSALSVIARSRVAGRQIGGLSRARLDLLEASVKNDLAARRSALERVTNYLPGDVDSVAQLAEIYIALRQYDKAEASFRQAVATQPGSAGLWNSFAYALAYRGKFSEANLALKEYARIDTASANPLDSQGEIALMAGKFGEAARLLSASYEKDMNFNGGVALEKAALARWLDGDRKASGDLLERLLAARTKRGDPMTELTRARWEYVFGQTAQARRRLERAASDPSNPIAPIAASMLAFRALASGDDQLAIRAAHAARSMAKSPSAALFAALASAAVGPTANASQSEDDSLRAEARAAGLTARGDWQRAAQAWQAALRHARGGADSLHREMLALCLVQSGRAADAEPLLTGDWPLLTPEQALLFDFLVYPNLFYTRAELALVKKKGEDAQRLYDLFLQYAGDRDDRFGRLARARAAARL